MHGSTKHRTLLTSAAAVLAVSAGLAASGPAGAAAPDGGAQRIAVTSLRGMHEVPGPGDPDGGGQFASVITRFQLCYSLSASRILPATAAHIHIGDPTVAGPIVVQLLTPDRRGVSACIQPVPDAEDTEMTLSDSELVAIRANRELYYVNVHNAEYPSGAIRGQLGASS